MVEEEKETQGEWVSFIHCEHVVSCLRGEQCCCISGSSSQIMSLGLIHVQCGHLKTCCPPKTDNGFERSSIDVTRTDLL